MRTSTVSYEKNLLSRKMLWQPQKKHQKAFFLLVYRKSLQTLVTTPLPISTENENLTLKKWKRENNIFEERNVWKTHVINQEGIKND